MKGRGHLNKAIAQYGRELVSKRFVLKDVDDPAVSPTGYLVEKDGLRFPCKIFTKVHDERLDMRVTGRDYKDILKLQDIERTHKTRIFLFFVDAALGQCYGDFFDTLMCDREFWSIQFPLHSKTHTGHIVYWSVDLMPTQFILTKEEKEKLALLISDNRNDKNQIRLL
jgi:hypothetical protein